MCSVWKLSFVVFIIEMMVIDSFYVWKPRNLQSVHRHTHISHTAGNQRMQMKQEYGETVYAYFPKPSTSDKAHIPVLGNPDVFFTRMRGFFQRNDLNPFNFAFFDYSRALQQLGRNCSLKERNDIAEMVLALSRNQNCSKQHLARFLKNMASCGFSVNNEADLSALKEIKKIYLSKPDQLLQDSTSFLTALRNLHVSWKQDEDKEVILKIIDEMPYGDMTDNGLSDCVLSILDIGVPWKALSAKCQQNILQRMCEMNVEKYAKSVRMVLYALSLWNGLNIKEMSTTVSSTFLKFAEKCLKLVVIKETSNIKTKQVCEWVLFFICSGLLSRYHPLLSKF
jgi:hypothetical protein